MQLQIELSLEDARDPEAFPNTLELEGIVVESSIMPESCGCYRISLVFIDLPIKAQIKLGDVSRKMNARLFG